VPTIAETLRAKGWRTGAFVAAYVLDHRFGLDRGFEVYDDDLSGARPQTVVGEAVGLSRRRPGGRRRARGGSSRSHAPARRSSHGCTSTIRTIPTT
jgi:hypothetical protein